MRAAASDVVTTAADEQAATNPASGRATWSPRTVLVATALVLLVGLGAAVRAHGFSSLDLWFDDAWAATPARVGWGQAIHMVLTAPGYGLALRQWIRLDPTSTEFLQLPSFVLSLAAIPVVYALLRYFRAPRWMAFAGALIAMVDPLLVQYSTRLKEYPFDLLGACLLLVLGERIRRAPSAKRLYALTAATILVLFVSAGGAAVAAGVWIAVAIALLHDRRNRRALLVSLAALVVGGVAIWAAFLRQLPGTLGFNWRRRGYLFDYRSLVLLERTVSMTFGGFLHAALAYPVTPAFFRGHQGFHDVAAMVLGVLVLGAAILVPVGVAIRARAVPAALAPAVALGVAVLLAVSDWVPLGDGRTDEALYPALYLCLAACVQLLVPRFTQFASNRTAPTIVARGTAAALVVGTVAFGVSHRSIYPTISLRSLAAQLKPLEHRGDVVFVDTFNSFGWCYYQLSPCAYKVGGRPPWPQGFRPVSHDPTVFIATHYGIPQPEFGTEQGQATQIWYVGFDYGTYDVAAGSSVWPLPVNTYMRGLLHQYGWRQALPALGTTVLLSQNCYALLFVRGSSS